jgi:protein phosphatase
LSDSAVTRRIEANVAHELASNPGANRSGTRPLQLFTVLAQRPAGAIFGDRFLYYSLLFSDTQRNRYLVTQLATPDLQLIRVCPNPLCGAVFLPKETGAEKFCTDCGSTLVGNSREWMLVETSTPLPKSLSAVAGRGLAHGSVRAPILAFEEQVAGVSRFCVVSPQFGSIDSKPDTIQALKLGIDLARGLDYLHENGVTFNGRIDSSLFGIAADHAVWADFWSCTTYTDEYITDRLPDLRSLATLVFSWLTGKTQFEHDPALNPTISQVFEQVINGTEITTGREMADALEHSLSLVMAPEAVDFWIGRQTNVGMLRNLNEDSVLTLEMNRIQQSVSQPLGVFVVADGMGGHAAGELASGTIVNSIAQKALEELFPQHISQGGGQNLEAWLREAVETANKAVFDLRKSAGTDMGSTLVSAVLEGNHLYVAHVGDSRIYIINAKKIQQITTDHSLVERLVATNQISREEARYHPQRNVIYRTIGDKGRVEVDASTHILAINDHLLLCSDGLSGMIDDQTMQRLVLEAASPEAACDALISAANAAGGDDNISVIIVRIIQA